MRKPLTKKQIEDDAYTLAAYVSLESLTNELEDCENAISDGHGYPGLEDVIKVFKKAIEVSE